MKKVYLVLFCFLLIGFGNQIGNCQTGCTNKVKITVKKSSDFSSMDAGIEVNGENVTNDEQCYSLTSGCLIEVTKLFYKNVRLRVEYISPSVKEIVLYLNNHDMNVASCHMGTTYNKLLSGIYKYSDGTNTALSIYHNNTDIEPYSDNSYSICLENNEVVYKKDVGDLFKILVMKPEDSDTRIDVIIDDRMKDKDPLTGK